MPFDTAESDTLTRRLIEGWKKHPELYEKKVRAVPFHPDRLKSIRAFATREGIELPTYLVTLCK